MPGHDSETSLNASERKIAIDALLTYGLSLAGLIQSRRFLPGSPQQAKLLETLQQTTVLLERLGGQVPAEMRPSLAPDPKAHHVH